MEFCYKLIECIEQNQIYIFEFYCQYVEIIIRIYARYSAYLSVLGCLSILAYFSYLAYSRVLGLLLCLGLLDCLGVLEALGLRLCLGLLECLGLLKCLGVLEVLGLSFLKYMSCLSCYILDWFLGGLELPQ